MKIPFKTAKDPKAKERENPDMYTFFCCRTFANFCEPHVLLRTFAVLCQLRVLLPLSDSENVIRHK